jgi:hypothetical protein
MMPRANLLVRLVLAVLLSGSLAPVAAAQSAIKDADAARAPAVGVGDQERPAPKSTTRKPPPPLPVDLERIERDAGRQPAVKLDDRQLRFYVLILAKEPRFSFKETVGDYDLMNGPTKGGAAMTHKEFLAMVTPRELNELFGSTSGSSFAMFQAALMNATGQMLVKKAIQQIRHAHSDQEVSEIRQRIDTELRSLNGQ